MLSLWVKKFAADERGVFTVKFALTGMLLLLCIGIAIDFSRLISNQSKLQAHADAAVLNAAKLYNENDSAYEEKAKEFFMANSGEVFDIQNYDLSIEDGNVINLEVKARMKPMFVQIFGYPRLDAAVVSEANYGGSKPGIEIAIAIDNTYSLAESGAFTDLSQALDVFLVALGTDENLGKTYVSFIPWGATVNVGTLNSSWINPYSPSKFKPDNWHGCLMARSGGLDVTDTPPSSSSLKFTTYSYPTNHHPHNNWVVRPKNEYVDVSPYPKPSSSKHYFGPNATCNIPMTPLTNKRSELQGAINQYKTNIQGGGGTMMANGMVWAYRSLSPKWQGYWKTDEPDKVPSTSGRKIIIFLSDGSSSWNGYGGAVADFTVYGRREDNFLKLKDYKNRNQAYSEMRKRFLDVCDNAKRDKVEVYTIAYKIGGSSASLLKQCASSNSHFYNSPTSKEVKEIFEDIMTDIGFDGSGELRLVR